METQRLRFGPKNVGQPIKYRRKKQIEGNSLTRIEGQSGPKKYKARAYTLEIKTAVFMVSLRLLMGNLYLIHCIREITEHLGSNLPPTQHKARKNTHFLHLL